MLVQSFIERLRPLVGCKSWDYIVLWKLSDDNRCIEWMDCCCGGTHNIENGGEDVNFEDCYTSVPCRDIVFPHPRITSCELLDQIPSSVTVLDSGVHSQTLLSNQASWLNFSHNTDLSLSDDSAIGTRVLIPLPLGLLELFVTRQVPEDQQVIDFIRAQCNIFLEHQARTNSSTSNSVSSDQNPHKNPLNALPHPHVSQVYPSNENMEFPHACTSLNPLQNFSTTSENGNPINDIFLEGTTYDQSNLFATSQSNMMSNISGVSRWMDPSGTIEDQMNDESYTCENKGSDESDPNEDEDDAKYRRRNGKGPQSKNLVAERKRRKKLNDRLYSLRALVPNISKLDRASILGDAIDYVKDLKKQVDDLQIELEEHSDNDEDGTKKGRDGIENSIPPSVLNQNGPKREQRKLPNGCISEQNYHEVDNANDKVQQMEPQVEVFQLEGNEFLVKVFCEHKCGGFVRLMEALNSLGLEVTDVTATRHTCLVSSIFKVERKNEDIVHADHVRESLLELTRNPSRVWPNVAEESDINRNNIESDNYHIIHHNNGEHSLFLSHQMNSHHHH